ncbi:hypothetical protein GCM10027452_46330 [Micromonospora halotolerans]
MAPNSVPDISLNDGNTIPQLGFGVFQIDPKDTVQAVRTALEVGYRHIDTAEMYGNEAEVGQAVRTSGLDRSEVFVTSKLSNAFHRPDDARKAFTTVTSCPPGGCWRSCSATAGSGRSASPTSRWRTWSGWPPRRRSRPR